MSPHDLYLAHRDVIERALTSVCRRHRLDAAEAEDFCSNFRLRLLEDDCAVIRKFQGRSSIQTYLISVVVHALQDWRNARWGKWRPSTEARRLGPLAIHLEELLVRERLTLDTAHEWLKAHRGITETRTQLEALAARFPRRVRPSFVPDDGLGAVAAPSQDADLALIQEEAGTLASRAAEALREALRALPPQDQLILRLIVEDDLSIADVARVLRLEQKPLYRRLDRLLQRLRTDLERAGVSADAVAGLLAHRAFDADASDRREDGGGVRLFMSEGSPAGRGDARE